MLFTHSFIYPSISDHDLLQVNFSILTHFVLIYFLVAEFKNVWSKELTLGENALLSSLLD